MKKNNILLIFAIIAGLFLASCEKDRNNYPTNPNPTPTPNGPSRYLLVGNEGAFGTNTASLSRIDLNNNTVENNVYQSRNVQALGDVLQSMERIGDFYYFVVNNSNKILVTDTNFNKKAEIQNLKSPRYIKAISASRAYVTSIFNDKIYIIDLPSNTKVSEITLNSNWTEQMALVGDVTGNYIYVCENDTSVNFITKINVATNQIVDSISIAGVSPSQIGTTSDGHLWVLGGNNFYGKVSTLTEINPANNSIVRSFKFDPKYTTGQMAIGPNDEKYVTVVDYNTFSFGVYKFASGATSVPANFFTSTPAGANYYGIAVDPGNGDVYISDSKGFTQAGDVNRYNSSGTLLETWTTAIGPSSFHFVQ